MSLPIACISGDYYKGKHDFVVDGYNGLLFKPQDINELADAINRLIEDVNLRKKLAANARNVRNDLHFEVVAKKLKDFILNEPF
jgi:glycosyltransferase involved in cell wall biosynthesis